LTAVLPIAGWWSKDEILGGYVGNQAIAGGPLLLLLGLVVAGMTAFYMFRATHMTFSGTYRGHHPPHESPRVMTGPLWALAILSLFVGFVGIPNGTFGDTHTNVFEDLLHNWHVGAPAHMHVWLAVLSTVIAIGGALLAGRIYRRSAGQDPLPAKLGRVWSLWSNLWYVDRFYLWLVRVVQQGIAKLCWWFERWVLIQGGINGLAQATRASGNALRMAQGGRLGAYVTSFVVGAVIVLLFVLAQLQVR
jgi:NADH-quinone oxidoreductase subunit L